MITTALKLLRRRSVYFWMGLGFIAAVLTIIAIGSVLSWLFWDHLHGKGEPLAPTIRNVTLVIAAPIALALAIWRSAVAGRQANIAQRQAELAQQQAELAERGFLSERYQKGAEMLGSGVLSVRLGGIYALQRLAEEHPVQYHIQIMRLFSAFARNPTKDGVPTSMLREDVNAVLQAILDRGQNGIELENRGQFSFDLTGSDLRGAYLAHADLAEAILVSAKLIGAELRDANLRDGDLRHADLSNAQLSGTRLNNADLFNANLTNASFIRTDLSNTYLNEANLTNATIDLTDFSFARLDDSNLSDTKLSRSIGLSQGELDRAWAEPDKPPRLTDCIDSATGEQLEWHDNPCP